MAIINSEQSDKADPATASQPEQKGSAEAKGWKWLGKEPRLALFFTSLIFVVQITFQVFFNTPKMCTNFLVTLVISAVTAAIVAVLHYWGKWSFFSWLRNWLFNESKGFSYAALAVAVVLGAGAPFIQESIAATTGLYKDTILSPFGYALTFSAFIGLALHLMLNLVVIIIALQASQMGDALVDMKGRTLVFALLFIFSPVLTAVVLNVAEWEDLPPIPTEIRIFIASLGSAATACFAFLFWAGISKLFREENSLKENHTTVGNLVTPTLEKLWKCFKARKEEVVELKNKCSDNLDYRKKYNALLNEFNKVEVERDELLAEKNAENTTNRPQ